MNKETLDYYDNNAEKFISGTVDVVFNETQDLFLSYLKQGDIVLDFGCGSGRDSKYFISKGLKVEAIDGSIEMCKAASKLTGIEVKQMLFEELNEINKYDGVWACSSILHCDSNALANVLKKIHASLKENGILYTSFKYGTYEGMRNGRYFIDLDENKIKEYLDGFSVEKQWITSDVRPGRSNEKWLNIILRKNA